MILSEYRRFSQTLGNTTPDVRKVANLVLQHWDDLFHSPRHKGRESRNLSTWRKLTGEPSVLIFNR